MNGEEQKAITGRLNQLEQCLAKKFDELRRILFGGNGSDEEHQGLMTRFWLLDASVTACQAAHAKALASLTDATAEIGKARTAWWKWAGTALAAVLLNQGLTLTYRGTTLSLPASGQTVQVAPATELEP